MTEAISDYKFGPMLGKKSIDISSNDYESDDEGRPFFTVVVSATTGNSALRYEDALGNEHTEKVGEGQVVIGGPSESNHPIPLYIRKVYASGSDATEIVVAF